MANTINTAKKVELLLAKTAEEMNFEIADVEFVKEGQNYYLRVYLDKEGGITIDDCEVFSKAAEKILDKEDPIEQAYIFEVSSPGIDRPLKKDSDFEKFSGEIVDIKLYKPLNGSKEYQGALKGLVDNNIIITDDDGNELVFDRKSVASVRLAVIF